MKREAEAADLRSSASGRIGHSQQVNWSAGSKDSIQDQDQTDQNDQRDDNYVTKGDKLKEADHLETENKRVPFWRKLTAYRPWKSKRSSSDLEGKGIFGGSSCDDCCYCSCFWRCCSCCSFLLRTHQYRKRKQGRGGGCCGGDSCCGDGCCGDDCCGDDRCGAGGGGGGAGCGGGGGGAGCGGGGCGGGNGGGGKNQGSSSWEPNPGIKRPTVTVVQTPPPPRP